MRKLQTAKRTTKAGKGLWCLAMPRFEITLDGGRALGITGFKIKSHPENIRRGEEQTSLYTHTEIHVYICIYAYICVHTDTHVNTHICIYKIVSVRGKVIRGFHSQREPEISLLHEFWYLYSFGRTVPSGRRGEQRKNSHLPNLFCFFLFYFCLPLSRRMG